MLQSWRWFGPTDPISLREIRQGGVQGIVTALHHVRCGELWTSQEIRKRREVVEAAGMKWVVVESLPIHESIKTRSGNYRELIEIYKASLRNLAAEGPRIICYNFMPVLDWTRTDVARELPDGSQVLYCRGDLLAAFDLFILKRPGAQKSFTPDEIRQATAAFETLDEAGVKKLSDAILLGLPGTVDDLTLDEFREHLARYDKIDERQLRSNYYGFLREILPLVEELGLKMAVHPDDPPRSLFGLPRIVSTAADLETLFTAVPSPANGLTLCTGSLGARQENDPPAILQRWASRVFFAHFRNVTFEPGSHWNFYESPSHLEGQVDMARAMKALLAEEARRRDAGQADWAIALRPDHGKLLDMDQGRGSYPGYSSVGRMLGLAELRGLEKGLLSQ